MTETILRLLTRLSEAGDDAILSGELAAPLFGPVFDRLLAKRVLVEHAPLSDWEVATPANADSPVGRSGKRAMDIVLNVRWTADTTSISPRTICACSVSAAGRWHP
jgi:hypothetical protein